MKKQQKPKPKSTHAEHGEKMIEVQIRFWTNKLAKGKGNILPKHCRASGVVKIQSNKVHGIKAISPLPFHSLMDITYVMEKVFIECGITVHTGRKMIKYLVE